MTEAHGQLQRRVHHPATGSLTPSLFIAVATIAREGRVASETEKKKRKTSMNDSTTSPSPFFPSSSSFGTSTVSTSTSSHFLSPPPSRRFPTSWAFFFLFGHIRDFFRNLLPWTKRKLPKGFVPVRQDYEDFYTRRMFYRIHDCWNRPIGSAPDAYIDVLERAPVRGQKPLELTGRKIRALNLGSYNYLGFAAHDPYCTPRALETLGSDGWSSCSSRAEAGTTQLHLDLEKELAAFLGKPAAVCFGMGFATNSAVLPVLAGPGCLIVSDALNHASIVSGARGSGARVAVFAHNDVDSLEAVLRSSVARGQPRSRRPWKKVLVVVEGIYSMEGELAPLPDIVAVCKRYKAYLYLDEAHSIGALGATGRGVCEALGVDPGDVDVMMGTFTKSFGGAGGYIAGSKELIDSLKRTAPGHLEATAMSPPVAQQVLSALRVLSGADGSTRGAEKLRRLRDNANYLRKRLLDLGVNVLGDWDSPVMPIMLFQPGKIAALSRECLKRGVAMVVVGFPATPLLTARARVCVSAAHSREDLDYAVDVLDEVAGLCLLRYGDRKKAGEAGGEGQAEGEQARQRRTRSDDDDDDAASSAAALIS